MEMISVVTTRRARAASVVGAALFAVLITACATSPSGGNWDEVQVRRMAQERWNALLASRYDEAYEYMSAGSRVFLSMEGFKEVMPKRFWTGATVSAVHCNKERCDVATKVGYRYVPRSKEIRGEQELKESWIKEAGEWRYVYAP